MKNLLYIIGLIIAGGIFTSCDDTEAEINFKDQAKYSVNDYIVAHKTQFSDFLRLLQKSGVDKIISAYNPYDLGYTLFLPTNEAIAAYIQQSGKYNSLDDMLEDTEFVEAFCRYHVVSKAYITDDFPFGAFSAYTLSGDLLTVSFIANNDSSYYNINNQAPVVFSNIETSNGYIHILGKALKPVVYTTYDWLELNEGYSIFKQAVDVCGLKELLSVNIKLSVYNSYPFTLLLEHDSVFEKQNIKSLQDLQNLVSPGKTNYTDPLNPLYNFVTYHMLTGNYFLDDFEKSSTNYNTYSDIPLNINGTGVDIMVNKAKEVFDTLIVGTDTTIIDYVGVNYDYSNVLTNSGVVHFVDQVLTQKAPNVDRQDYQFYEEPYLGYLRQVPGTYLIEDSTLLNRVKYTGTDLFYVAGETSSTAWNDDYLMLNGNFTISYTIPKLVQGTYNVYLRADCLSEFNAVIQVMIDGKPAGGLINLATGGASWDPFYRQDINDTENVGIVLGKFNFIKYEEHTITIKSLIPGRFLLDDITFRPAK